MATIRSCMLRDSVTAHVPAGVTVWQAPTDGASIHVTRVHVQRQSGISANAVNQEVQTQATVYVDARLSMPRGVDWLAIKQSAESVGASLGLTYAGHTYAVQQVREYRDGVGGIHHYEIEVV